MTCNTALSGHDEVPTEAMCTWISEKVEPKECTLPEPAFQVVPLFAIVLHVFSVLWSC